MDLPKYLNQLTPAGRTEFARRAGTSITYLYHLASGFKAPPKSIEFAVRIVEASDVEASGLQVTLGDLDRELFPDSPEGRARLARFVGLPPPGLEDD